MDSPNVGMVYIISPKDEEGEPKELYFVVTEGGYLLHIENMGRYPPQEIQKELARILYGLEHRSGRYNDFVKDRGSYKIRMALDSPLTVSDARRIDEKYKMTPEERRRSIEKEKHLWIGKEGDL